MKDKEREDKIEKLIRNYETLYKIFQKQQEMIDKHNTLLLQILLILDKEKNLDSTIGTVWK